MIDRTILQRLPTLALAAYQRVNLNVLDIGAGVKASLIPIGDAMVVAIPGTDPRNWSDLLSDLRDVERYECPGIGTVGKGPMMRAMNLWYIIKSQLPNSWYLTGHSLGGAVALGIAALAVAEGRAPLHVMTFAAPLCLGRDAALAAARIDGLDFARYGDLVPMEPNLWWLSRPRQLTIIGSPVPLSQELDLLAHHAMAAYEIEARAFLGS